MRTQGEGRIEKSFGLPAIQFLRQWQSPAVRVAPPVRETGYM